MTREEEIRARCEAATPGPWYNGDGSVDRFFAGKNTVATPERVIVERATYNDEFDRQTYADIGFIAHAREDIPYLLAENARLRAELEAASDSECDKCRFKLRSEAWKYYRYPCSECRRRTKDHFDPVYICDVNQHAEDCGLCAENGGSK